MRIPFNRPYMVGRELEYIGEAVQRNGHISGNGPFTWRCQQWLRESAGSLGALLTQSCTAALEMSALLLDLERGDEVIMPSFTFVSTANAFALRGAVPVFVDIEEETLNISPAAIEAGITPSTRAICVVHYAGVACDMDRVLALARRYGLVVIEDAAQGVLATYRGRQLGSLGALGALSFHETKNVISGEGGALLINDAAYQRRAEILWEKGTDRQRFFRGEVDKYTWQDLGSSYVPSDMIAAFLWAQLENAQALTERRRRLWRAYHERLAGLEASGLLARQRVPEFAGHNAHMYYIIVRSPACRAAVLAGLRQRGVHAVFHYVPLHTAPAAARLSRTGGALPVTEDLPLRLIRLPLWTAMAESDVDHVVSALRDTLLSCGECR